VYSERAYLSDCNSGLLSRNVFLRPLPPAWKYCLMVSSAMSSTAHCFGDMFVIEEPMPVTFSTSFEMSYSHITSTPRLLTHSDTKQKYLAIRYASHCLWNQRPTSLRIHHPNYSSPSQQPSFKHAGLTCYTLLSPSITFSLFHSELKTQKILSSTLVCFCLSD